jgi:hypothetical protein
MSEVLALALSFPSVIYTVLLGVMIVYWLFVMVGAVDLGEGAEGALEGSAKGMLEGSVKGALEGSMKGALEGSAKGALEGNAHAGEAADGSDDQNGGTLAALLSALRLQSVPVTVVLSLIITFSWLVSMVGMQLVTRTLPSFGPGLGFLVLVGAAVLSLPITSLAARPLAPVFAHKSAPSRRDLVGKTCTVRTGVVNRRFGEALLEDGGAGLVIRVRSDGRELRRGEHALIVDWEEEREAFVIEPMRELLEPPKARSE